MEISEHTTAIGREAKLLAEAAEQGGLDADVPTCPGWNIRELLRHLSMIHMWAAAPVAKRTTTLVLDDLSTLTEYWPDLAVFWPDDDDLIDWYLETNANLVQALESAPSDLDCPTFLPAPSPLAMWARRQAHETAIHRFDAQSAVGAGSGFDPVFASDGIDELLAASAPRRNEFSVASTKTMMVQPTDTDDRWHMTLAPDGITTIRGDGPADVTLTGDSSDLYLVLWNRAEDSTITFTGDSDVLDLWHNGFQSIWPQVDTMSSD